MVRLYERRFVAVLQKHIDIYGEVSAADLPKLLARAGVELQVPYARVPHGQRCARCRRRLLRAFGQEFAHNIYGPKCYQIVTRGESVA